MSISNDTQLSNELTIGNVKLKSKVILAPMAGITDTVLRQVVREFSPNALLVTEMLSSEALKMNIRHMVTDFQEMEYPLSFQICGHKPALMVESAKKLEARATLIDINMGCPAPKIVKNNDGASLMRDIKLSSELITAIRNAVNIPVTVKFRLGWDYTTRNYIEFAKMAEDCGANAITVHGRTKSQMYAGVADWNAIAEIKQVVKIPVIANGDIISPESAAKCLEITGCDGIAVGRGILGDPSLLFRIERYLETGEIIEFPNPYTRLKQAMYHCEKEIDYRGEIHGIKFMRKFFGWYIKGIRDATRYREKLVRVENLEDLKAIFNEILLTQENK